MKLPAYPRTKPSGVEWLGDVPEHWEVKRLRRVLAESLQYGANESAELDDPDLPRYVRITDVHENGTLRPDTFRSLPEVIAAPYVLKDGDLLFARSVATSGKTFLYQTSWGICAYAGYLIRAHLPHRHPRFTRRSRSEGGPSHHLVSQTFWHRMARRHPEALGGCATWLPRSIQRRGDA